MQHKVLAEDEYAARTVDATRYSEERGGGARHRLCRVRAEKKKQEEEEEEKKSKNK
jgi:hypothetical protein